MLTKDDLEQIGKMLSGLEERLTKKIETVDLKVEAVHEFNKKAHAEIMGHLAESNEVNQQQLKKLEKRVEQIEEDQLSTHKN